MRLACLAYLLLLTALLLASDPLWLVRVHGETPGLVRTLQPVVHLLGFFGLSVLALMARWPVPRWAVAGLLTVYAGLTEVLQELFPPRTAEWADWFQNLAGIAAGTLACWGAAAAISAVARRRAARRGKRIGDASENWGMMQRVASRGTALGPSWWI